MPHISSSLISHGSRSHKSPSSSSSRALVHQQPQHLQHGKHNGGSTSSPVMGRSPSLSSVTSLRTPVSMDPDCFICGSPARARCNCEHEAVTRYVEEAEKRAMSALMDDVRLWATTAARTTIQSRFRELESQRRARHSRYISSSPPTASNYSHADRRLKEGTNEDWKMACSEYPRVLEDWYTELGHRLANGWGLPKAERERSDSYDEYSPDEEEEQEALSPRKSRHSSRRSYESSYDEDLSGRMVELSVNDRRRSRPKQYHSSSYSSSGSVSGGHSSKYRSHQAPITIKTRDEDRHRRRSDW